MSLGLMSYRLLRLRSNCMCIREVFLEHNLARAF